ncbi:MAG: hypothetical protein AAF217_09490 [Pseudomonadota bacterium]
MKIESLLELHDDETRWEAPANFDYAEARTRFAEFVDVLEAVFETSFQSETGLNIQDASFHSQIFFDSGLTRCHLIRFSNFGDMVAIADDDEIPLSLLIRLQAMLTQAGYTVVPFEYLEKPYTGLNAGVTGIDTWWIRYFDYV